MRAFVSVSIVVNVFDDTTNSVSAGSRSAERAGDVGAVDVGDEAGVQVRVAVGVEGPGGHRRAEVGAADADVDDGADAPAGGALPVTAADTVGEVAHAGEHLVDVGHDVVAVELDPLAGRRAQGDVEDGAVLADVDPLAGEHRVPPRGDAGVSATASRAASTWSSMRCFE